jgi:soluble lytic murein transglycosylase-like protein
MLLTTLVSQLSDIKAGVRKSFQKFRKITPNHSYLNLSGKLMTLVMAFAIIPINSMATDNFNYQSTQTSVDKQASLYKTSIVFDKSNPMILSSQSKKIQIEVGVSNFELANNPKITKSDNVLYPEAYAHRDPEIFRPIYMAAANRYNIPWQLIEAVHEVESGKSGSTNTRSYAGATGPMQFMPGTWRAYGVDGDGDGKADITNVTDSIYAGAHYLAVSGADEGRIDDALFNYNHSQSYVNKVKRIAHEIGLPK